jgi:dihydropteroate synthase
MGIVNVTPDSFSDGGDFAEAQAAVARGQALIDAGADILDIGGESTRPGSHPTSIETEIDRVAPVIAALAKRGHLISIDSRHAVVMAAALDAGAKIINDVTALTGDPDSLDLAARSGAPIILMHMLGAPLTMQQNPTYQNVVEEIRDYLAGRIDACRAAGIAPARILVDPGIGFGKTVEHNVTLIRELQRFGDLAAGVLLGASRKSFIGALSANEPAKQRLGGSIAVALAGAARGARVLRVHDVAETVQALKTWRAVA